MALFGVVVFIPLIATLFQLMIVEHDKYGATYRVKAKNRSGFRLAWLCNVAHTVFGGEHPTDIYIHSITNNVFSSK